MLKYALPALLVTLSVTVMPAKALRIAMPMNSTSKKTVTSEVVVQGKVQSIEKDVVEVPIAPNAEAKQRFKVAVIKIEKGLVGVNNLTHIKVGFLDIPNPFPPRGGINDRNQPAILPAPPVVGGPIQIQPLPGRPIPGRGPMVVQLVKDQEGIFFLERHPTEKFYIINFANQPILTTQPNYKDELKKVEVAVKTLKDPMKALEAKDAQDRYLAASTLIAKYRNYPTNATKGVDQVEIDAKESKLILQAFIDVDWKAAAKLDPMNAPNNIVYQLGMTANDGWKMPPFQGGDYVEFMRENFQKWAKEHKETFRIKKMVAKQ